MEGVSYCLWSLVFRADDTWPYLYGILFRTPSFVTAPIHILRTFFLKQGTSSLSVKGLNCLHMTTLISIIVLFSPVFLLFFHYLCMCSLSFVPGRHQVHQREAWLISPENLDCGVEKQQYDMTHCCCILDCYHCSAIFSRRFLL